MTRADGRSGSVTPDKDLHAGRSIWQGASGINVATSTLTSSRKVDVAIVGAGISGAFLAHAIAPRYERVAVLDRRQPAHGATLASTAMLQFEIDQPLTKLSDKIGAAKAARAWRRSYKATQAIARLVRDDDLRCGFERRDALYLTGNDLGARGMEDEARVRARIGLPTEFMNRQALRNTFGIDRTAAILSGKSAIANPMQLAAGLLRRAVSAGAKIYSPVNICDAFATAHGVILDTGRYFIEARKVVFCTGYEMLKGIPAKGIDITSSWATATRPKAHYPRWLDRTLLWEASTPYLYMRTTPDGRLLAGGEDEQIDRPGYRRKSLEAKSARIARKANALIKGLSFIPASKWSGAFGESADGLPIIDAVPGMPNCFTVMGFGGNGTVYSMIASQIMPGLLAGRASADADLYRFR